MQTQEDLTKTLWDAIKNLYEFNICLDLVKDTKRDIETAKGQVHVQSDREGALDAKSGRVKTHEQNKHMRAYLDDLYK